MNSGRSGSHCVLTTSWPGLTGLTGLTRPSTPFSPSVLQDVDGRHEAHEAGHDVERPERNNDSPQSGEWFKGTCISGVSRARQSFGTSKPGVAIRVGTGEALPIILAPSQEWRRQNRRTRHGDRSAVQT